MDDLQDRYDELEDIEITLRRLADDVTDEEYKEIFQELMYKAQSEKEEIEPRLQEMYDAEDREREREYWNSKF